ncbi:hypothetical protein C8K63_106164 [Pseudomonas sp. GV085]|nr:hypothetical protein C8K63_106164 [Pseudomonas sp. GV085]
MRVDFCVIDFGVNQVKSRTCCKKYCWPCIAGAKRTSQINQRRRGYLPLRATNSLEVGAS